MRFIGKAILMAQWFSLLLWFPLVCFAGLESDLQNFFDHVGMSANITSAESYHGQQAGYYTGGSVFARNRVRQTQIASLTLPKVRAGCGGIDLFTGGFSFISSQELVATMRNIVSNATSYAFMLALKSMTPEISNVMEYAEGLANSKPYCMAIPALFITVMKPSNVYILVFKQ